MPNKHAALRQLRKDMKRRQRNQAVRSQLKTVTKEILKSLTKKDLERSRQLIDEVARSYDRAAAKGIIHHNSASRTKSRLTRQLNRQLASAAN